jgi:hypothetical protein
MVDAKKMRVQSCDLEKEQAQGPPILSSYKSSRPRFVAVDGLISFGAQGLAIALAPLLALLGDPDRRVNE